MERIACVTGADRGLGFGLCASLLQQNWRVIAGQYMPEWPELDALYGKYPDHLHIVPLDVSSEDSVRKAAQNVSGLVKHVDVMINNAGVTSSTMHATIREPQNYEEMHRLFNVNTLGSLRILEAFISLLDQGEMKRLCFVSSEAGSIERCERESWFGYTMSKAALNMAVKTLFNHLHPMGYTFRLYHPGWLGETKSTRGEMEPEEAAEYALAYFLGALDPFSDEPDIDPEDRLVLRDWLCRDWPW